MNPFNFKKKIKHLKIYNYPIKMLKLFTIFIFVFTLGYVFLTKIFNNIHNAPLFSIIVTAFNSEDYIEDTILSIVNQNYDKWELILVNDGSTDSTLQIMKKFANNDKRIRIINQTNKGLSISRNNAIEKAKGKYIWFVDSDDLIEKNSLSLLENILLKNKEPDVLNFYNQKFDIHGLKNMTNYDVFKVFTNDLMPIVNTCQMTCAETNNYPVTPGKFIFKHSFLNNNNIRFIPNLTFEDEVFVKEIFSKCARLTQIKKILYFKRIHSKQITANKLQHYDSLVKLPQFLYEKLDHFPEPKRRCIFLKYFNYVFTDAGSNNPKFIPDLEEFLIFLKTKPEIPFWIEQKLKLENFIYHKKISLGV